MTWTNERRPHEEGGERAGAQHASPTLPPTGDTTGQRRRDVLDRFAEAYCATCCVEWAGNASLSAGAAHATRTGHPVIGHYRATYRWHTPPGGDVSGVGG